MYLRRLSKSERGNPSTCRDFFFFCYGHHRDLHSFPTRRSSDLRDGREDFYLPAVTAAQSAGRTLEAFRRSEEHTSELQSLTNLVCRLLLEKKKKIMDSVETSQQLALGEAERKREEEKLAAEPPQ